jgi:hypothetical protein
MQEGIHFDMFIKNVVFSFLIVGDFWTLSIIWRSEKHSASETGSATPSGGKHLFCWIRQKELM